MQNKTLDTLLGLSNLKDQKSIFVREVNGDRFVSIGAINMLSYEIDEDEDNFFVGVLYAHIGVEKIPILLDDEGNRADLMDRMDKVVSRFVNVIDFETLDTLLYLANPSTHYDDFQSRVYGVINFVKQEQSKPPCSKKGNLIMNHIYTPYDPNALEDKEELDRKIGFYVRSMFELGDQKNIPTEMVTFVYFNEIEFKTWLGDRDNTKEAREHWMRQRIYDAAGGEMKTYDSNGKRIL